MHCDGKIDQNGISKLKYVRKLHCSNNECIYDVNHLSNTLIVLSCAGGSRIDQNGISKLGKLEEFVCVYNEKINSIDHLKETLKKIEYTKKQLFIKTYEFPKLIHIREIC